MLHSGYTSFGKPDLKDVQNVINFDLPDVTGTYKEACDFIADDSGAVYSIINPKIQS